MLFCVCACVSVSRTRGTRKRIKRTRNGLCDSVIVLCACFMLREHEEELENGSREQKMDDVIVLLS